MSATPEFSPVQGRAPLSRDRIIDSALALAKEQGLAAVSMRGLAKELNVQPMSLYYHIPSRAVLMVLMAERSMAAVPQPPSTVPWDERLVALLLSTYHAGVANPAVFPVLASETLGTKMMPPMPAPAGGASVAMVERVQALLAEAGVPEPARPGICRGLFGVVVGFLVGQVDGLVPTGGEASPESGPEHDPVDVHIAGAGTGAAPPEIQAMHAADPAVDLADALWLFVRGVAVTQSR